MRTLARLLDGAFIDPLMGLLLPGAGDVIGSLLGMYTVMVAIRRKVSPVVIARMIMNLGFDLLLGIIPLVGDIGDFVFKANRRNVDLMTRHLESGGRATAKDWMIVIGALFAFFLVIAAVIWGVVSVVRTIM